MKTRNLVPFLLVVFCLTGCVTLGPDYERPDLSTLVKADADVVADAVIADKASNDPIVEQWWLAYQDNNLNQLVRTAIENNRNLKALFANLNAARSNLKLTTLNYLPNDTLSLSTGETRQSAANLGPLAPRDENGNAIVFPDVEFNTVSFAPRWEIDLFGKVKRQREIANAQVKLQQAELRGLQLIVITDVISQYFRLQSLYLERRILLNNIAIQAQTSKLLQTQFEFGRVGQRETLSAQSRLNASEASLPNLDARIQESKLRLALLSGYAPGQLDSRLLGLSQASFLDQDLSIGTVDELLDRQANILQAEERLRAANAEIGLSIARLFPSLSLGGSVGYASDDRSRLFDDNAYQFSVGPTLNWSLTNLLRGKQQVDSAKFRKQAAAYNYEQSVLQALTDLNIAIHNHQSLHRRLEFLELSAASAVESARIARIQYQEGATSLLQLLTAQADQLQRELEAQRGVYELILSQVTVFKVLGI